MNRFNSVVYAQHFDAKNSKKWKKKKKKTMQFTTIQNTRIIAKHFEKLTNEIYLFLE